MHIHGLHAQEAMMLWSSEVLVESEGQKSEVEMVTNCVEILMRDQ